MDDTTELVDVLREHYGDSAAVAAAPAAVAVALITAMERTITELVDEHRRALADLDAHLVCPTCGARATRGARVTR